MTIDSSPTLNQLRECSEAIGHEDATRESIEFAKATFMEYIKTITPREHMRLCVDMIAALEIRDDELYLAMLRAVALHAIDGLMASIGDMLGGGEDGAVQPPVQEKSIGESPVD